MTPYEYFKSKKACDKALKWLENYPDKSLQEIWMAIDRSDWMLWIFRHCDCNISDIVYREMAYEFAAYALQYAGDTRPVCIDTLDVVSRYIDGDATDEELSAAWAAAWSAAWAAERPMTSYAARSAACAASSAAASDAASYAASYAAWSDTQCNVIRAFVPNLIEVINEL